MKAHTAYSNTDYSRTGGLKHWCDGVFKGNIWVLNPTVFVENLQFGIGHKGFQGTKEQAPLGILEAPGHILA